MRGDGLLGDKMHSMIFDNAKIKRIVPGFSADIPLSVGIKDCIRWYDEDPSRQVVDQKLDRLLDEMIEKYSVR